MELAIPLLALGGIFVISNQRQSKSKSNKMEGFTQSKKANYLPNVEIIPQNYPVTNQAENQSSSAYAYMNPNQATDKYFDQTKYEEMNAKGIRTGNQIQQLYSLTGNYVNTEDIRHNNMVPFYGAKMKGQLYDAATAESQLDNMVGGGSQFYSKVEQAPLFKPEDNVQWPHGAPNQSDFFQSRVNNVMKESNVLPFKQERVGPGLNQGYGTEGSGGFNSGMEARDAWLPKTINETRVATNPKLSYSLENHEGPASAIVGNVGILGKVEKYLPDTFFIQNQDRWLTTTGQEIAPALRPIQELHPTDRSISTMSYSGVAGGQDRNAPYVKGAYEEPHRQPSQAHAINQGNAVTRGGNVGDNDAVLMSYRNGNTHKTQRSVSESSTSDSFGGFRKAMISVLAPILDVIRPTRKEDFVDNYRMYGTAAGPKSSQNYLPQNVVPPTIKEMTLSPTQSYVQGPKEGAYTTSNQQPTFGQRDTTNCSEIGPAGGSATGWGGTDHVSYENQRNNVAKQEAIVSRTNHGNMTTYNHQQNVQIRGLQQTFEASREMVPTNLPSLPVGKDLIGKTFLPKYEMPCVDNRIQPDLLDAFRRNPYTQKGPNTPF